MSVILVKAAFDHDAGVWFVESSDVPGLNVEARSVEEFRSQVEMAIIDLLECSDDDGGEFDVPIEIIAHTSARARSHVAA
jgi:hypothetical protein